MTPNAAIFVLMLTVILSGVALVIAAMWHRARLLEMMHRERLAMIERGIAPPPETDPAAFHGTWRARRGAAAQRLRSMGVVIVGLGLGVGMLIGFAGGAPETGLGVGGAIALVGLAFVVNGMLSSDTPPAVPPPPPIPRSDRGL